MSCRILIKEALYILEPCGLHPFKRNRSNRIINTILFSFILCLLSECILNCFVDWDGLNSAEGVINILGFYQGLVKYINFLLHKNTVNSMLKDMESFWLQDNCNRGLSKKISRICRYVHNSLIAMTVIVVIVLVLIFLPPVLSTPKYIPLKTYHFKDSCQLFPYIGMYIFQLATIVPYCINSMGIDWLFIALTVNIICELKMLREKLECKICDNLRDLKSLHELIDHHNLILECIKKLSSIFSLNILNFFLSDMLAICCSLLSIIKDGFPLSLKAASKYSSVIVFYVMQLMFYGVAGTCITFESELVAQAVYESKWWNNPLPQFRGAYVLIIQRANKMEKLSGGGMFILSVSSVANVLRMALSFFTMVQAVYSRENQK